MICDYHLHSEFSFDSSEKIENIVEKALQMGIDEIALTDHAEFPLRDTAPWPDFVKREAVLATCRERYGGLPAIRSGIETGQPWRDAELEMKLTQAKPDFIIAGGDFITSRTAAEQAYRNEFSFEDAALSLLQSLRGVAPVYFVNGNHEEKLETSEDEVLRGAYARFMTDLSSAGVRVLHNEKILLGDGLLLYGYEHGMEHYEKIFSNPLTLPEMQEEIGFSNPDLFCLLAVHNPKFFPVYARWGADLTVSGHVHGGLMRIGKRGVIGPDLHLFPEYSGGLYHKDGRTMILSCGIGAHTLPVRIFNPGEVTVVDIVPLNQ